ncbi:MAG: hypothetical protein OEM60_08350 [Gammaproteobacteria bacterium]|nr:hypothetical protein [Gammaproteobacteria bacterium]MDH3428417.1 hypothetical protein [Gammaproteobacteria bacterium]MDH3433854.1 hypothetical protein [Gammaproteobacteria bacterium]
MAVRHLIITTSCLLIASSGIAADSNLPFGSDEACMQGPLAQFGRYIGDWKIEDSRLSQDGSGWQDGTGARWIFSCLGDGTAIQDFWLPPDGNVGTNLRTYNAETDRWDIAWAINTAPGFSHIQAEQDPLGNIVMHYVAPVPSPLRRITFFPPDDDGWNWQLEFSADGGETWFAVYRIHATPFTPD